MAFAADADPRYGQFGLRSECPACGAHLPVNGPADQVECADCGEQVDVPAELVGSMLEAFERGWPDPAAAETETIGDKTWRWTAEAVAGPSCPACSAALSLEGERSPPDRSADPPRGHESRESGFALRSGGASTPSQDREGPVTCGQCSATVPRERVPKRLRKKVRTAAWIIGGEVDQSRAEQPPAPVALSCPSCGAGLSITSRHHRVTPCDHCGSRVHLPDAVWRALHPPRKVEAWWVRFEGESRAAARARGMAAEAERRRQQAEEDGKRKAEKAERKAEAEAKRRAREAKAAEQRAESKRQRAEEEEAAARRRAWIGYPLAAVAALLTVAALAAEGLTAGFVLFGHGRWIRWIGLSYMAANLLEDVLVVGTVAMFVAAWLVGIAGATRASGTSFFGVLPWCAFMVALSVIPVIGPFISLFFAVQHFRGAEPTIGTENRVPRLASAPLGLLHLGLGPLAHLAIAALGRTALGTYLP
jgi:hypothetical protein